MYFNEKITQLASITNHSSAIKELSELESNRIDANGHNFVITYHETSAWVLFDRCTCCTFVQCLNYCSSLLRLVLITTAAFCVPLNPSCVGES